MKWRAMATSNFDGREMKKSEYNREANILKRLNVTDIMGNFKAWRLKRKNKFRRRPEMHKRNVY